MVLDPWRNRQREVLNALRGKERTQEDVARAAGLKFWRYVNLETGKVELAAREVDPLARAFNLSPNAFASLLGMIAPPYNLREELRKAGADGQRLDVLEADLTSHTETEQRAAVKAEGTLHPKPATPATAARRRRVG